MLRKLFPSGLMAMALAATVCLADPPAGDKPEGPGKDGGDRPARRRFDRGGQRGEGPGGMMGGPMQFDAKAELAKLNDKLKLDETQQAAVGKLLEEQQTKLESMREKMRPTPEQAEKFRALRDEMAAARDAGDQNRVAELRKEMQTLRGGQGDEMRKSMEEFHKSLHDGIVSQLHDDQKANFETYWTQRMEQVGRRGGPDRGPLALKSAVDKLDDLTPTQKDQIETIFKTFRDANRDGAKPNPEAGKKLHEDVMALLTDGQKAKIEQALAPRNGPGPGDGEGRPRGARRNRPGKGDDEKSDKGV